MLRTRLLWFSLGFTVSAASISHFVWKDLWVDRHSLATHMKQKFDALEARVSNLESVTYPNSTPEQARKKLQKGNCSLETETLAACL